MGPFSVFTVFVGVSSCFWCGRLHYLSSFSAHGEIGNFITNQSINWSTTLFVRHDIERQLQQAEFGTGWTAHEDCGDNHMADVRCRYRLTVCGNVIV